jgi:hypothetical protein
LKKMGQKGAQEEDEEEGDGIGRFFARNIMYKAVSTNHAGYSSIASFGAPGMLAHLMPHLASKNFAKVWLFMRESHKSASAGGI